VPVCSSCNKETQIENRFCPNCGCRLWLSWDGAVLARLFAGVEIVDTGKSKRVHKPAMYRLWRIGKELGFHSIIEYAVQDLVQIRNYLGKIKDIEPTRIYPLVMSRHVKKWKLGDNKGKAYTYCIIPQSRPAEKNENQLKKECPKTWEWLSDFRDQLLNRKSKSFAEDPFYSIFGLGDWDSKYKVIWKSMGFYPNFVVVSSVNDKYLGKKVVVAEHVQYFIPTNNKNEAHYICALLNSAIVKKTLFTLSSGGKSGLSSSIIKKIRIDKFNPKVKLHTALASYSMRAHSYALKNNAKKLRMTETAINKYAEQLYKTRKKAISELGD
jgi:RNA polymerase subunit RPABC4/transcription elongation factor Spt4